ncbi:MAG: hypothetical protein Q9201_003843 [Fulgogasparrea decipioides]
MARKLQDRLALASYKTQNGLDNLSLNLVEAHLENTLKRKRPASSTGASSDSSSSTASDQIFFSGPLSSSPNTAAMFSDDIQSSMGARPFGKRYNHKPTAMLSDVSSATRKRSRTQSMAPPLMDVSRASWKRAHNLPQSSPGIHQHEHFPVSHATNLSFASDASTIPNTPPFVPTSDDEGHNDLNHSFRLASSQFRSSPPCTPPPTHSRRSRPRKGNAAGEEGAELLMHLATSPSPADQGMKHKLPPPSTPPSTSQALPSSMMTPGASGFPAVFNTPGQNFAWADFVQFTPSPRQGAFGNRTPGLSKTPLAAKEARRRLNLDSLGANLSNAGRDSATKDAGLGMELGGELVS